MLARLGQHRESETNEFVNVTPCFTSSFCTFGIDHSVSQRWSSVRITITFVRFVVATTTEPGRLPPPAVPPLVASTTAATITMAAATAAPVARSPGVIATSERTGRT